MSMVNVYQILYVILGTILSFVLYALLSLITVATAYLRYRLKIEKRRAKKEFGYE